MEVGSNWQRNRVEGNLIGLCATNVPVDSSDIPMEERLNEQVIDLKNQLTSCKQTIQELETNLLQKKIELKEALETVEVIEDEELWNELSRKDEIIKQQKNDLERARLWVSEVENARASIPRFEKESIQKDVKLRSIQMELDGERSRTKEMKTEYDLQIELA